MFDEDPDPAERDDEAAPHTPIQTDENPAPQPPATPGSAEEPLADGPPTQPESTPNVAIDLNVTILGDNHYAIDQAVIYDLYENPEQMYSQIRIVPHKASNGEIDGYRLSGIRRNSIFYQFGWENGDILHTVNGMSLTSMSSAMEAYRTLSNEQNFAFEITRQGQHQTLVYEIR